MKRRLIVVVIAALVLLLAALACGNPQPVQPPEPTATSGPVPTPTLRAYVPPPVSGPKYPIVDLSTEAIARSSNTVESRMTMNAWTVGIAIALLITALGIWVVKKKLVFVVLIVATIGGIVLSNIFIVSTIPGTVDKVSHDLSNTAITAGVAQAQKAQATNFQYIHANIVQIGMDVINCERTVNRKDDCGINAPQYEQYEEINVYYTQDCTTDSNGDEHCTTTKHWDDEWTPWFDQLRRYKIVADTKARYLSEAVYSQFGLSCLADDGSSGACTHDDTGLLNDSHKPVVYLHGDWRAPEDVQNHLYRGGTYMPTIGAYNNHVPDIWTLTQKNKSDGGPVVDATFIGPYFNWGFAADSPLFEPYTGHYQDLLKIASLPMADGATFTITDSFGKQSQLHTLLTSTDGDLPVNFNPITVVGNCVKPRQLAGYKDTAMALQGDFGPHKQGSLRWFLVCDSIVSKLGGMPNVLTALKAYERDQVVWGLVSMPQNLVIIAESVSDDGSLITGRGMETGMPAGNVLVKQDIMASISGGNSVPLTQENMFGSFTSGYVATQDNTFKYQYSDLTQAGSVIGLLYQKDPNYVPPDPSSKDCSLPKADHHGFIRYSMCNNLYLKTTIEVNQDGHDLIMATVDAGAVNAIPVIYGWLFLVVGLIAVAVSGYNRANSDSDDGDNYRSYSRRYY